ncbi:MAG: hypothetical protein MUF24_13395, partial [Chitinophagaceae bacterium]|nr:hypothetical protein [Chitinophagaceae bacterium]
PLKAFIHCKKSANVQIYSQKCLFGNLLQLWRNVKLTDNAITFRFKSITTTPVSVSTITTLRLLCIVPAAHHEGGQIKSRGKGLYF